MKIGYSGAIIRYSLFWSNSLNLFKNLSSEIKLEMKISISYESQKFEAFIERRK